jgi:hypothetical protein
MMENVKYKLYLQDLVAIFKRKIRKHNERRIFRI